MRFSARRRWAISAGTFRLPIRSGKAPTAARSCVTVICERPKVGPHAEAMRRLIAQDLGIGIDAVSVKATTTEKLGFTGRGEGIAAQAVCLLVAP
jgi:2-C-methyl-D-erythritol 2,4-cyclodiphosphate synthase